MSSEEIIKIIESIDKQLVENKKFIDVYGGKMNPSDPSIVTLCELSKLLIQARESWFNTLLHQYGIFYMRGA